MKFTLNRFAIGMSVAWLLLLSGSAVMSQWLPVADPDQMDLFRRNVSPNAIHWLGTDTLGRDLLARVISGAKISLTVGLLTPSIGMLLGVALGVAAGYFRGLTDVLTRFCIDTLLAFPGLVLALIIPVYWGRSVWTITVTLGILSIPVFARVSRKLAAELKAKAYVQASQALGMSELQIIMLHVLPGMARSIWTLWLLVMSIAIVAEGGLSFLGLGIPPPQPSWGSMIAFGRDQLEAYPGLSLIPALVLFLTVSAVNCLAEKLNSDTEIRFYTLSKP